MWLAKKLQEERETATPRVGVVTAGGADPRVMAGQEFLAAQGVFPYGVYAVVPTGARAVVLGGLCLGVTDGAGFALEEGEVCLYSKGGASLVLKNSGEVLINGKAVAL